MHQRYSEVVETIFTSWLESLEEPDDPEKVIDGEIIKGLKKLIDDGKINNAAQIRRLIEDLGGKNAA